MSNNKRMVIAFALTAIILFIYMFYQSKVMKPVYSSNTSTNSAAVSNNIESWFVFFLIPTSVRTAVKKFIFIHSHSLICTEPSLAPCPFRHLQTLTISEF